MGFVVTAGHINDCTQAIALLGERTPGSRCHQPPKSTIKQQRKYYNRYRQRNRIERRFSRLKHFRRFATKYEKLKSNFLALVALACSWLHLPLYVDTA